MLKGLEEVHYLVRPVTDELGTRGLTLFQPCPRYR
jgi:hypothetical protein